MAGLTLPGLGLSPLPNFTSTTSSAANPTSTAVFGPLVLGANDSISGQLPSQTPALLNNTGTLLGIPVSYYVIGAAILFGVLLRHKGL